MYHTAWPGIVCLLGFPTGMHLSMGHLCSAAQPWLNQSRCRLLIAQNKVMSACGWQFDDPHDAVLGEKAAQMRARKRAAQGALCTTMHLCATRFLTMQHGGLASEKTPQHTHCLSFSTK